MKLRRAERQYHPSTDFPWTDGPCTEYRPQFVPDVADFGTRPGRKKVRKPAEVFGDCPGITFFSGKDIYRGLFFLIESRILYSLYLYPPLFPRTGRDFGTGTKKASIHVAFSRKQRVKTRPEHGTELDRLRRSRQALRAWASLDHSAALPARYAGVSLGEATRQPGHDNARRARSMGLK